jgi:polysaccharide export outer membrane protein/exopolysaccharide production protein ExoF
MGGVIGAFCGSSVLAADTEFALRPQTRVKVSVVEWVAALGEYKEWTALNGEFTVSQAGRLSVPLIGSVDAAGKPVAELATAISDRLRKQTGLSQMPVTTVEIVRYPPVYVTGPVQKPGEVDFKPGLTVMQAVAMAGGRERRVDTTGGYSELEQIRYLGDLNRIELQLKQLGAKKARLEAELAGRPAITFPQEFETAAPDSIERRFVEAETALFAARAQALASQLKSLDDLVVLLQREIAVLDEKMLTQDRQVAIAEKELADVSRLVSDQTLTRSRQTSLERIVADLQSGKLDMTVASMRAKQKVSETERDALSLKSQRTTETGRDLQAVEAEIDDLKLRRVTALQLLQSMGASLLRKESGRAAELQPIEYWITRSGGEQQPVRASDRDMLEPGDVIEVRYSLPASIDGETLSSASGIFGAIR